jgi:ketosteroid isomerase-like protein
MSGNRELVERFIASLEARDWDAWAELLHPAVVYEIPQSRKRIRGRDRYGGLIIRVTDFWPEPYQPPPGREHLAERW